MWKRKIKRGIAYTLLVLVLCVGALAVALENKQVQRYLIDKVVDFASRELHTEISISKIRFSLASAVILEDLLVRDQARDTLFYTSEGAIYLTNILPSFSIPRLKAIEVSDVRAHFYRQKDSTWNFDFLRTKDTSTTTDLSFLRSFQRLYFHRAHISVDDTAAQLDARTRYLYVELSELFVDHTFLHVHSLASGGLRVVYKKNEESYDASEEIVEGDDENNSILQVKNEITDTTTFATMHKLAHTAPSEILRKSLNTFWDIPWKWSIEKVTLEDNAIALYSTAHSPQKISGNIYVDVSKKYDNYAEQTLRLTNLSAYGWHVPSIALDIFADKKSVLIKNISLSHEALRLHVGAQFYFSHLADSARFARSFSGTAQGSVPLLKTSLIQQMFPTQNILYDWVDSTTTWSMTTGKIIFNDSTLRADSMGITQNKMPFLRARFTSEFTHGFQNLRWQLRDFILYAPVKSSPALYTHLAKIWDSASMEKLTHLNLYANCEGTTRHAVGDLRIESDVGDISLSATLDKVHQNYDIDAHYHCTLKDYPHLRAGVSLGSLNGQTHLSFSKNKMPVIHASSTHIHNLWFHNYLYQHLSLDLSMQNKVADAQLRIEDPALNTQASAQIDFHDSARVWLSLEQELKNIDFKSLHFAKETLRAQAKIRASVRYEKQSADVVGSLRFEELQFANAIGSYFLDKIQIESMVDSAQKRIRVYSHDLGTISVASSGALSELPSLFQTTYYTLFPYAQNKQYAQDSHFIGQGELRMDIKNFTPFNTLVHTQLKDLDQLHINYVVSDTGTSRTRIMAEFPYLHFGGIEIKKCALALAQQQRDVQMSLRMENVRYDSLFNVHNISLNNENDLRTFHFTSDTGAWSFNIHTGLYFEKERTRIVFYPSTMKNPYAMWQQKDTREIQIDSDGIRTESITFTSDSQRVRIFSENTKGGGTRIRAHIQQVDLGHIMHIVGMENLGIAGKMNLHMRYDHPPAEQASMRLRGNVDAFVLNFDSVGRVDVDFERDEAWVGNKWALSARTHNPDYDFSVLRPEHPDDPNILLDVDIKKIRSHILYLYTKSFFADLGGHLHGHLQIKNTNDSLYLEGGVHLDKADITVDYTQCTYSLRDKLVRFERGKIIFDSITFRDILGNTGTVNGVVFVPLSDLQKLWYSFHIYSDYAVGLNTTSEHNSIFYGRALGKVDLRVKGNGRQDSLWIDVAPDERTLCNINIGSVVSDESTNALRFVEVKKKVDSFVKQHRKNVREKRRTRAKIYAVKKELAPDQPSVFHARVVINAPETDVGVYVILDRSEHNVVSLKGRPALTFFYDTQKGLGMNGIFNVSEGKLTLMLLKDLHFSKAFVMDKTYNNFLNWTGDISNPLLNLKMSYLVPKVPLNSLEAISSASAGGGAVANNPSSTGAESALVANSGTVGTSTLDMDVSIVLTGTTDKMDMNFDINPASSNTTQVGLAGNTLNNYLQNLRLNPEQMRKQASSLLLLGIFNVDNQQQGIGGGGSTNVVSGGINSYASQLLSGAVGAAFSQVNNSINQLIKSNVVSLGFDYNAYNTYQIGGAGAGSSNNLSVQNMRNQVGFNINLKFTERWRLRFSPGVDFNLYNAGGSGGVAQNPGIGASFLPNANLSYNITRDGLLTLNAFNTTSYDNLVQGQRNRTGVSLLLSKDFDLFDRKKKKKKKKSKENPKESDEDETTEEREK